MVYCVRSKMDYLNEIPFIINNIIHCNDTAVFSNVKEMLQFVHSLNSVKQDLSCVKCGNTKQIHWCINNKILFIKHVINLNSCTTCSILTLT